MAKGFLHLQVPKLREYEIVLAELCALDLWNGFDYETGEILNLSDEDFISAFAIPTQVIYNNSRTRMRLAESDIRTLINQGKLKALFRSANPTNFSSGISSYRRTALRIYSGWKSKKLKLLPYHYATQAVLDWSSTFVASILPSRNGNHRVSLANRILFYAMPDMLVFNFSNGLAKALNLQSRPQAALPYFNEYLHAGMLRNRTHLSKLKMPPPTHLPINIWIELKKSSWWKRRVLDLALLLHFGIVFPRPTLHTEANKIIAKRRKLRSLRRKKS